MNHGDSPCFTLNRQQSSKIMGLPFGRLIYFLYLCASKKNCDDLVDNNIKLIDY